MANMQKCLSPYPKKMRDRKSKSTNKKKSTQSISTNAWNDMRFQKFYDFSNKRRDDLQSKIDEVFVNAHSPVYKGVQNVEEDIGDDCRTTEDYLNLKNSIVFSPQKKTNIPKRGDYFVTKMFTMGYWDSNGVNIPKCFCLVNDMKAVFLKNLKTWKPILVVDFDLLQPHLICTAADKLKRQFKIRLTDKFFAVLFFDQTTQLNNYLKLLKARRLKADASYHLDLQKSEKNFFKKLYIREDHFLETANSGDVLLFR